LVGCGTGGDEGELTLDGESNSGSKGDWEENGGCGVLEDQSWQRERRDVGRHCCGLLVLSVKELEVQCLEEKGTMEWCDGGVEG